MTLHVFASINIDRVYRLAHFPKKGGRCSIPGGDRFTGAFLASLDAGLDLARAGRIASAAVAICVTRAGTTDAIPSRSEIETFLSENQ